MIAIRIVIISLIVLGSTCILGSSEKASAQKESAGSEMNMIGHKDKKASKDLSGYPVIGHLEKRDKIITIRTGPDGPLYTVETKDGKILAVNLPAEKLFAEFPELKNVLERGLAIDDATLRSGDMEDLKAEPIVIHQE